MKNNVTIRIMGNFEQNTQQNDSASIPMIRIQLDGGSGSGNWGHVGRPGKIGGSGKGGGAQNRLQTPSGGFTSRAQAEKENRHGGKNSKGPGSAGGNEISRPKTPLTKEQGMKRIKSITSKMGDISTYTERFIPADPNWPDGKYSGAFFEVLGYNNLPKVVSEKEFDQIKSPFPIQYRGGLKAVSRSRILCLAKDTLVEEQTAQEPIQPPTPEWQTGMRKAAIFLL